MNTYLIRRYYKNTTTNKIVNSDKDFIDFMDLLDTEKKPIKIEVYILTGTQFNQ